ncbi:Xaa-Pro aminopeptidase [Saccharopolyspora sp. NPDC050642]|uniref:Xaa-Pro aminopeptidase n=1 Tax=Saccharopolyspora sp. NPDC050642 TaxID=3157099 RepID=UPI0033EE38C5
MDAPKMVTPVIADRNGERFLLAREQETGNLRAHGVPAERLRFFDRYVSFDNIVNGSSAVESLADAVAQLAGSDPIVVGGDLPYSRYLHLHQRFGDRLRVEPSASSGPVVLYRLAVRDVQDRFARLRSGGAEAAARVLRDRPHLRALVTEVDRAPADTRFDLLTDKLAELNADAVLSAAPPNVSELTGLAPRTGLAVLWTRSAEHLHCVAPADDHTIPGDVVGIHTSATEAVRSVTDGGRLAIEEQWLDTSAALSLRDAGFELAPASLAASLWREERNRTDLAFMVIAAQASRYCIEGALQHAQQALDDGAVLTERDVYRRYLELIPEFRAAFDIPFAIAPYFANCHAADRTIYPAIPTEHPLTADTKTLKFDAGLKITVDGVVLATSDIARSLVRSAEGQEAYRIFTDVIRNGVIPGIRPGTVCEKVHHGCVELVLEHEAELVESGIMPAGIDLHADYGRRNVGHLMGKQESFLTELRPGHTYMLGEGSFGACEIQWPYHDHSIASEDLWYIGRDATYAISS